MTNDHLDDVDERALMVAELRCAWQQAKTLWSSDPTDPGAYTAFIRAGTALYQYKPPDAPAPAPASVPRVVRGTARPGYLRKSPLGHAPQGWPEPTGAGRRR
ncbi:hypothetical protein OG689_43290 [Kitasatospora sp. NBC_00240]|uniref:hypothetical protein n=1 Tax=Kitasatospora sp. NBC_00240 TaxID=2903567 RepID=UPI0022598A73|nr:hypothetical protein [Kitasatospora sp. NBC_00240]MCX5215966.1 hypothetical protein [Kitasatospora sp. NBC_00240]